MTLIYDETGKLLWTQRNIPWLIKSIQPEWLKTNGFHEIETNVDATSTLLSEDHSAQEKLKEVREDDDDAEMTHSVAVNIYPATARMPQLTIVGGRYHSDRAKTLLYGVELVRIRAGRQFTVSHSFTVDRRLVELTPYRGAGAGSPRT
ncbi:sensor protein PhoQ, regulator of virulence determinants [Salmonella enterica subsp. enterica]|uniref:Sensor protein PhoQ, regulator of virulence determinants n=1 Tax=Salmonella enterica I TaxID=59201 RepID=A0A379WW82_SALET|nr:sensor protein PhoQ, regulator of virulence determinants [Salmonella enterica subsp. enterica]